MQLDLIIQIDYMKDIEKLSLVLMKSLNLYIKDGMRIYFYSIMLQNIFCKTLFVLEFDIINS